MFVSQPGGEIKEPGEPEVDISLKLFCCHANILSTEVQHELGRSSLSVGDVHSRSFSKGRSRIVSASLQAMWMFEALANPHHID